MPNKLLPESFDEVLALAQANDKPDVRQRCFASLDLTALSVTDSEESIVRMVDRVNCFAGRFPGWPSIAAICVYPALVPVVKETLQPASVRIASVAAGFPASQTFLDVKLAECCEAVEAGANELDIVLPVGRYLAGHYVQVANEISSIKQAIGHTHLKVILETGALVAPQVIYHAAMLAMEAGADFIKTSTGKFDPAATPEAFMVMAQAVKDYHQATGKRIGLKAAGGIATIPDALVYYSIVQHTLGEEWLSPDFFRIGASRLANELLACGYFV